MNHFARLRKAISQALEIPEKSVTPDLAIGSVEKWDSMGHLILVLAIEREFGIKFRTEEIPKLDSVGVITDILKERLKKDE